jgi:hypothetical protein
MPLDYESILSRYTHARKITFKLGESLVGLLSREVIVQAAKLLGMWKNGQIHFKDEDQSSVLFDFAIYDYPLEGPTPLDAYADKFPPNPRSDMESSLALVRRNYYSLFEVEAVVSGVGVHVHDLFAEQDHFIADRGFSQTVERGFLLATRIFPSDDFLMTSGAGLPCTPGLRKEILRIKSLPKNQGAESDPKRRSIFDAEIIRLCLNAPGAPEIRYGTGAEGSASETALGLPTRRTGRNDPCPCGSGKKYKKCCGG